MKTEPESVTVVVSAAGATFCRGRIAAIKARVRHHFDLERQRLELERRGPGYTWRGWWYPRALVLGLLWLAILVLFGLLVVGLFTHPTLGA